MRRSGAKFVPFLSSPFLGDVKLPNYILMNMNKQEIIEEIRKTAKENGGKPLGTARFEKETGINPYQWGKYWPRFGDAQKEAGFMPNQLQGAHADSFLLEKIISLTRKLSKFPTSREIQVERNSDPKFSDRKVFERWGTTEQRLTKVLEYCKDRNSYADIVELCQPLFEKSSKKERIDISKTQFGEVYLFKSGRYYKIGRTNDAVRRGNELRVQLPEKCILIHSIKTDDPSGIEAYWHKRFDTKRMQGEWFDLAPVDVKAFKSWRRVI